MEMFVAIITLAFIAHWSLVSMQLCCWMDGDAGRLQQCKL